MAGPYQRLSNGQSADSGAQAITTVVNAVEAGLEDAEATITAQAALIAGKAATAHTHTGTYDPAGSAATAQAVAVQRGNHTGTQLASTISDFQSQVRLNRLNEMAAPTAAVSMGLQQITDLGTPTNSTHAATKAYVDSVAGTGTLTSPYSVSPLDYGVRMNGSFGILKCASGSATITSQTAPGYYGPTFKSSDVGATIRLTSGTFSQAVVTRTIDTVNGAGTSITVSGGTIPFTSNIVVAEWSHDTDAQITANTVAMQACIDAAQGRVIEVPPGTAIFDDGFMLREGTHFRGVNASFQPKAVPTVAGQGTMVSCLMLKRGVDATFFYSGNDSGSVIFDDIVTWGTTNPGTTNFNVMIHGPSDGYQCNTLFRNARMYGGNQVLYTLNTSVGVVIGGIFGGGRNGGVIMENSPDWAFLNADVHQYTNWEHGGTPPGANGTCYQLDYSSGVNSFVGSYVEFGTFGMTVASASNTITACRFSDSRDSGLALSGDYNTVTGNTFVAAGGYWGGYTTGARAGIWVGGDYNTISGNAIYDMASQMQKSVRFYTTANNNKLISGATPHAVEDLGTGNVVI